jgi:hypothetical protein
MTGVRIACQPLIVHDFGDPTALANCSEYTAVAGSAKSLLIFRSSKLIALITPQTGPAKITSSITSISLRICRSPLLVGVNGSPQIALYRNSRFAVQRLPVFLLAKHASIMSSNVVVVADGHTAFFWDLGANKCTLCFTSNPEILGVFVSTNTFIFTTAGFTILLSDRDQIVHNVPLPSNSFVRAAPDLSAFGVVSRASFVWIPVKGSKSIQSRTIELPQPCRDFALSSQAVLVLLDCGPKKPPQLRKWNHHE